MSIPQYDQRCNPLSLGNFDFSVEAQGSLLSVRLTNNPTRQTKKSVADDDWREWLRNRAAVQTLVGKGARELDWYLINTEKQKQILHAAQPRRGTRKNINTFSKKSRLRLLRTCAKLDMGLFGLFMTFTYRENMTDARRAKDHLEKLSLWLKRHYPDTSFIWRMENQERGALHFHILALNRAFIPADELTTYWQKLTLDNSYPDIKKLRSRRKVMYYVSKYISKVTQVATIVDEGVTTEEKLGDTKKQTEAAPNFSENGQEADVTREEDEKTGSGENALGFISLPYSDNFIGRFWGVINRNKLPLAVKKSVTVHDIGQKAFFQLKRYARRYWKHLSRRLQNFYLFVDNGDRWLELVYAIILS